LTSEIVRVDTLVVMTIQREMLRLGIQIHTISIKNLLTKSLVSSMVHVTSRRDRKLSLMSHHGFFFIKTHNHIPDAKVEITGSLRCGDDRFSQGDIMFCMVCNNRSPLYLY
jgi:hypothetical protein